jgi:hypothetical protein
MMNRNAYLCLALLLASSTPLDAKEKMTRSEAKERIGLLDKSQFIVFSASGFEKDNDYYTVQIVLADEKDDTPSNVSDDGQVIFTNSRFKTDQAELLEQSIVRRLAHKPT